MKGYKKQHIVSQTYLKHFSINGDGKSLFIIDDTNKYQKGIQCKNSGDSIFWEKNYSDSNLFTDEKAIEKMFGQEIEPNYNFVISELESKLGTIDFNTKIKIVQWIFYTKMRSPIWERSNNNTWTNNKFHLENFINPERFTTTLESFVKDVMNKRWTIYSSPNNKYWWTSDNPGYCIDLKSYELGHNVIPDPFIEISGNDTILIYPLSKTFCLCIHPYNSGEDLNLNLSNTNIRFETAGEPWHQAINYWTLISQSRLIISPDETSLKIVEKIKTESN